MSDDVEPESIGSAPSGRLPAALSVAGAFALYQIPWVGTPLKWVEVFLHESSHGLAALATGGGISKLNLHFEGSGVLTSQGGFFPLVAFAGYAGAPLLGLLLARAGGLGAGASKIAAGVLLAWVGACAVLWTRDPATLILLAAPGGAAFLALKAKGGQVAAWTLRFVGAYVIVASLADPLYQLAADTRVGGVSMASDAQALENLTYLPKILWIGLWEILGGWCLWKAAFPRRPASKFGTEA